MNNVAPISSHISAESKQSMETQLQYQHNIGDMTRLLKLDYPYSQVLPPSGNNNIPVKYITLPLETNLQNQSKTFCTSLKVNLVDTKLAQTTTVPEILANKHLSNIRPQAQSHKNYSNNVPPATYHHIVSDHKYAKPPTKYHQSHGTGKPPNIILHKTKLLEVNIVLLKLKKCQTIICLLHLW